jgi:hypothetical protein
MAMRLRHSTGWNVGVMTLDINLYELTAPFKCCFGNGTDGNLGKFFKILKQKVYQRGKKIVSSSNL